MERLLFECAIRSTLIAAAAAAVLSGMRIKNVAARHSVWTSVLVFMLVLPLLVAFGHPVPLSILPPVRQNIEHVAPAGRLSFLASQIDPALLGLPQSEPKPGHPALAQWLECIYLFGAAVLLLRLVTGIIGAQRIKRQARPLNGLLTSTSCSSPITVGWARAVTILPERWRDWEPAKLDAVMTHEMEHARRHDPLVQCIALANRAIFWFHPLAWWLERRLASLSEEACDLAVLERGHHASDYCRYLLDVANSVRASRRRIRVLGMAMPGAYLPRRIQKMLNGGLAPRVSSLRMGFATAVIFLLSVGLSTAALVRAQNGTTTRTGAEITIQPVSVPQPQVSPGTQDNLVKSAVLPARAVLAVPTPVEQTIESVEVTAAKFPEQLLSLANLLQPLEALRGSSYSPELLTRIREIVKANDGLKMSDINGVGLRRWFRIVSVSTRDGSQADRVVLQIELGWGASGTSGSRSWLDHPTDVTVQPVSTVKASYPEIARQSRVQGDVVVEGLINPDGKLEDIRLISGHAFLVDAAIKALTEWIYPKESAGERTRATVTFVLPQ